MKEISIEKGGEIPETGETTYNVACGCKNFVFIGKDALLKFLDEYISDPDGYELRYEKKHGGEISRAPVAWWEEGFVFGGRRGGKENEAKYWGLSVREQAEEQLRQDQAKIREAVDSVFETAKKCTRIVAA